MFRVWESGVLFPLFLSGSWEQMSGSFLQLGGLGLKELGLCGIQQVPKPFQPSLSPQEKIGRGGKKGCGGQTSPCFIPRAVSVTPSL